ncbi:hypothetical protein Avbf_17671 [Armadillidium vulgare]|nr:hypothetical protein Avbf_17671 [Armadillidium vulgare]
MMAVSTRVSELNENSCASTTILGMRSPLLCKLCSFSEVNDNSCAFPTIFGMRLPVLCTLCSFSEINDNSCDFTTIFGIRLPLLCTLCSFSEEFVCQHTHNICYSLLLGILHVQSLAVSYVAQLASVPHYCDSHIRSLFPRAGLAPYSV